VPNTFYASCLLSSDTSNHTASGKASDVEVYNLVILQ
jgi:hypothetical protein